MTPSLGFSFFDRLRKMSDPEKASFLQNLIAAPSPTFETNFLEFKGRLENGSLLSKEKTRELYGKTISAFANTGGGVLIWGIHAIRDSSGVDSARSLALAPNAAELYSRLDTAETNVTNPPVLGIDKLLVLTTGGAGYVVCFIPESRHKPHASTLDERYYMRVSGHSVPVDHHSLRRLFFPEYHSRLELYFHSRPVQLPSGFPWNHAQPANFDQPSRGVYYLETAIHLHNAGVGTSEDIGILFKSPSVDQNAMGYNWTPSVSAWSGKYYRFKESVHPHEMVPVATRLTPINLLPTRGGPDWSGTVPDIRVNIFAKNEPPVEVSYTFERSHWGVNQVGVLREIEF